MSMLTIIDDGREAKQSSHQSGIMGVALVVLLEGKGKEVRDDTEVVVFDEGRKIGKKWKIGSHGNQSPLFIPGKL